MRSILGVSLSQHLAKQHLQFKGSEEEIVADFLLHLNEISKDADLLYVQSQRLYTDIVSDSTNAPITESERQARQTKCSILQVKGRRVDHARTPLRYKVQCTPCPGRERILVSSLVSTPIYRMSSSKLMAAHSKQVTRQDAVYYLKSTPQDVQLAHPTLQAPHHSAASLPSRRDAAKQLRTVVLVLARMDVLFVSSSSEGRIRGSAARQKLLHRRQRQYRLSLQWTSLDCLNLMKEQASSLLTPKGWLLMSLKVSVSLNQRTAHT